MSRILLWSLLGAAFWSSAAAHAALGDKRGAGRVEAPADAQAPRGGPGFRAPGLSWYLGVGGISVLALVRIRRLGAERMRSDATGESSLPGTARP